MYPRLLPGATVLIDRHYNSLEPYRRGESNLYAVARNGTCTVKYVEVAGRHLVLRPHNHAYPVEGMAIEEGKTAAWTTSSAASVTWESKPSPDFFHRPANL